MSISKDKKMSAVDKLRRQAEEQLSAKPAELPLPLTEEDTQRLVQEL